MWTLRGGSALRLSVQLAMAAMIAALAASATTATAAIVVTTYKGTVTSGHDRTGVFGTAGAIFDGMDFSVAYTTDDSVPFTTKFADSVQSYITGSGFNDPVTALVTIGGHSLHFGSGPGAVGITKAADNFTGGQDQLYNEASVSVFDVQNAVFSLNDFLSSSDYHHNLNYLLQPGDGQYGGFTSNPITGYDTTAIFHTTSVNINSGAPEPTVWALMVGGFGLAGAALRRRGAGVGA